jgi:hypothetical protein
MTDDTADLQRDCRQFRDLTTFVLAVVGAMLTLPLLVELIQQADEQSPRALLDLTLEYLLRISPGVFYLLALWAVRRTFGELSHGRLFQPALARGLRDVGSNLAWGAGMDVLGAPVLLRWVEGVPGSVLHFNTAAIALGVVGLALALLARLLKRAADMQAELDQFI